MSRELDPDKLEELGLQQISSDDYRVTSEQTRFYNCFAWAAGDGRRRWEPDLRHERYWPPNVPREYSLRAYILAFETLGYLECESGEWEDGYQKIAIYADPDDFPRHMARQVASGRWTSKLGTYEDIEHTTVESIEGVYYGKVVRYLKRRRHDDDPEPPHPVP